MVSRSSAPAPRPGLRLAGALILAGIVPQLAVIALFLLPPLSAQWQYVPWLLPAAGAAGWLWIAARFGRSLAGLQGLLGGWGKGDFASPTVAEWADAPPELQGLWDAARDVADTLRRERTDLHAGAERLESVFQAVPEGLLVLDSEGRIWAYNDVCRRMLRFEAADPRGERIESVVHNAKLVEYARTLMKTGRASQMELAAGDAGARAFEVQGAALRGQDGENTGFLIFFRDVTRIRYLERVRRDFTANVSHELRTPLTLIHGFVETLLDGALEDREAAARFLQIIREQTERLDALMDDILSLARLEREDQEPVPLEPLLVHEILRESLELCRVRAEERDMTLELAADSELVVLANRRLLEQAVVNLIDNAVKYSDSGKTVRVWAERSGRWAEIAVADEGWGIESRHLPRIFERFYRVDPGRSRELGGTGLGLSIVKHIMQVHHGQVDVESTLGKGSVFRLRLPLATGDSQQAT
ncbi:MAG: PAS domain-containing protein [Thermogutta sp.]|nr:PAS domain-containing protein [Thermogutta sp.]